MKSPTPIQEEDVILHKPNSNLKYSILILSCIALLGDYYCFDNPGALHDQLQSHFKEIPKKEFEYYYNLLYSVYSLPNIAIPFIGGILIIKYGYRLMFILFGLAVLIGQLVFSLGCSFRSIKLMIVGRIIFGLGGEAINATQSTLIVNWFNPSELSFALGVALSILRFGSVLNDILSPIIVTSNNDVSTALWLGFAICAISFLITLLVVYIDWRQDILIQMKQIVDSKNGILRIDEETSKPMMTSLSDFPRLVFMLAGLCTLLYSGVFPFNYIATGFLITTWYNNIPTVEAQHKAGFAMGLPFLFSAFIIPLIGIFVDKYGKRTYLLMLSCVCGIISFIFFFFINPIFPLILLGLCYGLFSSIIWPALSMIVGKELTGFVIGFTVSLQNTGLVISPMVVAMIYTNSNSYFVTLSFFLVIMSISLVLSIIIHFEDKKNNNILNFNEQEKNKESTKFKYDVVDSVDCEDKNNKKLDSISNLTTISTKISNK